MYFRFFTLFVTLLLGVHLQADGRLYVWTYEYQTLPQGHAEIESYTGYDQIDTDSGRVATTTLQYEYEIGMNNRFDVGIYQRLRQTIDSPLVYDGFKLRLRYRFGEKGQWFIDPLLYVEYKGSGSFENNTLEAKLILAHDFNRFNLSLNPVVEYEFSDNDPELEFEYAAGMSYRLHPLLSLGLEAKGNDEDLYLGPTLSHGKEDLWFAIGLLKHISGDNAVDRKIQFIIGLGL